MKITPDWFDRDPRVIAPDLLGKVLRHKVGGHWLCARIIEIEAYLLEEKGSHASLGWTPKRNALFMPPGTIYMYYARGGDSFNLSCRGEGNAVLIKSGILWPWPAPDPAMLQHMQQLNPVNGRLRPPETLCSGQTLFCQSLDLKVPEWDQRTFQPGRLELLDMSEPPPEVLQTTRLGISPGRDEHLPFRFIDAGFLRHCTKNPLTQRSNPPPVRRYAIEG
ncbi:MAG TPA: DNA-3-methyladenine glycosylase [Deltaproteobacteria bacterium]|jgi:DNA-3-methyladenine glycosylase|nr:DNA-3-methyladenine glycosylase [Deltaproteobacteria bacterium]